MASFETGTDGIDRRQFLKRAGLMTAWAVPTMQVVNMAGARASQVRDSATTPPDTKPPKTIPDQTTRYGKSGAGA